MKSLIFIVKFIIIPHYLSGIDKNDEDETEEETDEGGGGGGWLRPRHRSNLAYGAPFIILRSSFSAWWRGNEAEETGEGGG